MDPTRPADPPHDGHPLPPAEPWEPGEGDLVRLARDTISDPAVILPGTAITVTQPPDAAGNVRYSTVTVVSGSVPLAHITSEPTR